MEKDAVISDDVGKTTSERTAVNKKGISSCAEVINVERIEAKEIEELVDIEK